MFWALNWQRQEMVDILESLEIKVAGSGNIMTVTPPTIRQDLLEEEDYIEEVARIYGYDKMPVTLPKGNTEAGIPEDRALRDLTRDSLCGMGLNEIQTYSFVSPKGVDYIRTAEGSWERNFVKLINPLGEENSVMRTVLMPNMMEVLARNYTRNIDKVNAFEIGNTFVNNTQEDDVLPYEQYALCIGMYGKDEDFYSLKGVVEELFRVLGIKDPIFAGEADLGAFHPGRCARISVISGENGEPVQLGVMGEVHPDVAEQYGMEGVRIYCCELMFDAIRDNSDRTILYTPLPKYPSTSRDIALLVEENLEVGRIEALIRKEGGRILENVKLFDVYRGKQVEEGKKSVAFTLTYRDKDKTLQPMRM